MELPSFASLARIRILLLPVGEIQQTTFKQWSLAISSLSDIKLSDVPPSRDDKGSHLSVQSSRSDPFSQPVLCLVPSQPAVSIWLIFFILLLSGTNLFQSFASPTSLLVSLALLQHPPPPTCHPLRAQFDAAVDDLFDSSSFYPLATDCIVFEEDGSNPMTDTFTGLVIIPSVLANKNVYLGTILASLCSGILSGFTDIVSPQTINGIAC